MKNQLLNTLSPDPSAFPISGPVLIVEDHPVFADQLASVVGSLSPTTEIRVLSSGADALLELRRPEFRPGLVLIDLGLPDIGGIEVIRASRNAFPEVPILVITVTPNEEHLLRAIRSGATGYLLKSEPKEAIRQAVLDAANGLSPISPGLARSLFRLAGGGTGTVPPLHLSTREQETLRLLAEGDTYEAIAYRMGLTLSTVQTYVRSIYRKLEVSSRYRAVHKAREAGLL